MSEENETEKLDREAAPRVTEHIMDQGYPLPDTAVNLLTELLDRAKKDEKTKKFVETDLPRMVCDDFDEDKRSTSDWMEARAERAKLWRGALEGKTFPFENCANMHTPILLSRTLRLVSRVHGEIFKPGQPIFSAVPSSKLSEERADIVTRHQNWQFHKEIPEFQRHMYRALIEFFRDGDSVFYSYRDLDKNVNRHDHTPAEDIVFPYTTTTPSTDMADVPRKTLILRKYRRELLRMAKKGILDMGQVRKVIKDKPDPDSVDQPIRDMSDKADGVDRTDTPTDAPYTLLLQVRWVRFPDEDEEIPVTVIVHYDSKTLLSITSRYYDDVNDRIRYDREMAEAQQYVEGMAFYEEAMWKEDLLASLVEVPEVNPMEAQMVLEQVASQRPLPPPRPQWMTEDNEPPKPVKQLVHEPFTHMVCIENPDGARGLGVGLLLEPHQKAANIMLNQFIDQGTLANSPPKFKHQTFQLPPGTKTISPGNVYEVQGIPPETMEKGIFQLDIPQANVQLLQGVRMQEEASDSVSSAPDVLSGEREGTETFRGQATRVEQAIKQLSLFTSNVIVGMSNIARLNALFNSMFEPDQRIVDTVDPATLQARRIDVSRDLYRDTFDVIFSADLSFASRAARQAEADDILGMLVKGVPPQIASLVLSPQVYAAAIRKSLQVRGAFDMAAMLPDDQQIDQRLAQQKQAQAQAAMAQGGPPGQGRRQLARAAPGGSMPHPAVPTGQPTNVPGARPPQSATAPGAPVEATQRQAQ